MFLIPTDGDAFWGQMLNQQFCSFFAKLRVVVQKYFQASLKNVRQDVTKNIGNT
jgi:hypothetical protein